MKESTPTSCSSEIDLLASATHNEVSVAQILLDLPNIISPSEPGPELKWGRTRKRSTLGQGEPSSRAPDERTKGIKREEDGPDAAAASPVTPLSFSPSESDEKSRNASKKSSNKTSRKELVDVIDELTQRRDLLRSEIENVRKYYKKLKAYNSQLKAVKQKVLNSCQRKEERQHHQQPVVLDLTSERLRHSFGPTTAQPDSSSYNGPRSLDSMGPLRIPDLNLSAEEAFSEMDVSRPLDMARELADRRSRCAEARLIRRQIIKDKSMRGGGGCIKLPKMR